MKILLRSLSALALVFFLGAFTVQAHEIKLYLDQKAQVNEPVRIEFALGHFPDKFDHEHPFFKQVGASKLVVLDLDGAVIPLDYELQNDRYVAEFTPEQEGVYWVVSHTSRGVVDRTQSSPAAGMQLRYYDAKAPLAVGDSEPPEAQPTFLHVEIQSTDSLPARVGESFTGQVTYKGEKIADQAVLVVSPTERARELVTDEQGRVEMDFNETGTWLIKTTLMDEGRSGAYAGKAYDRVRYNSSLYLEITE